MNKKYIVRLTDTERNELATLIKKLKGTSQKVRRTSTHTIGNGIHTQQDLRLSLELATELATRLAGTCAAT